jgi:hypothetical protein
MNTLATPRTGAIRTGKVQGRRVLRFKSLDEAVADGANLQTAENRGKLLHLGNWTLGQSFGHLAAWISYGYDGFPLKIPWIVRLIAPLVKNKFINSPMRAGARIPRVSEGTYGIVPLSTYDGFEAFKNACERLKATAPTKPHFFFGALTHDEWIAMNLRHAELHLSFFVPE